MKLESTQRRLARLLRECDVSIGPALLLSAAFAVFVIALALNALWDESPSTQAAEPARQTVRPVS